MNWDSLPDALYGAAFVSSEGRVYRLFSDDDQPSLGGVLRLDSSEFPSTPVEDGNQPREWKEKNHPTNVLFSDFPSVSKDGVPEAADDQAAPTTLSIEEAIRRIRAVEGVWSRRAEEPAIRLLDTMSQSAADKSMRALSNSQTSKQDSRINPGKTDILPEEPLPKIFSITSGRVNTESCEKSTQGLERKNAAAPLCREIVVAGKPIFLGERRVNLTSEIRKVSVCTADVPPGVLEQSTDRKRAPFFVGKTNTRYSLSRYSGEKFDLEILPDDDLPFPTPPNIEHWEIKPYDTAFVLETEARPCETNLIALTQVDVPMTRRRQGLVPRRHLSRHRQMKMADVAEQFKATTARSQLNELTPELVGVIEETPPFKEVAESVVATIVLPEVIATDRVRETVKPQRVSFRWPPKSDIVKERASQQICLLTDRLLALRKRGRTRVCFHSFFPAEGCSTMLLCVVRELVERGCRVLVADANMYHPVLPELLGIALGSAERVTLIDERLELLPWGKWGEADAGKSQWDQSGSIARLKEGYDFVLIDGGSLTEGRPEEKKIFWQTTATDGVLLIFNAMTHRPLNLEAVDRSLRKHGVELLGVMENYVKCSLESGNEDGSLI